MAKLRGGHANSRKTVKRPKRGLVFPGYKYLGPFNSLNKGKPVNPSDEAALVHDNEYWHLSKKDNPYLKFNDADQQLIEATKDAPDIGGKIANWVFSKKRKLSQHGYIGTINGQSPANSLLITPPEVQRRKYPPRQSPLIAKRRIFGNPAKFLPTGNLMTGETKGEGGSNNAQGLTETPVDHVVNVTRGPPDYTFVSLPIIREEYVNESFWSRDHTWRMTSPYDTFVTRGGTQDLNTGAGTATVDAQLVDGGAGDNTAQSCRWFSFYAGMYNYYHTVSCRWVCTIENYSSFPFYVHEIYHNETEPPPGATNHDMMLWPGVKSHYVGTHAQAMTSTGRVERNDKPSATAENREDATMQSGDDVETTNEITSRGLGPVLTISGSYEPGDFKRLIHLDSMVENWTSVTGNPALSERLTLRIRHASDGISLNSANSYDKTLVYNIKMKCEYLVEFKELKMQLRFPIQRQPITVTLANTIDSTS